MEQIQLLDRGVWLRAFLDGEFKADDGDGLPGLKKGMADVVKGINVEERTVDTVISSDAIDRDRDTIDPKKWDLKDFRKNPVVQWAHDGRVPAIATGPVKLINGKLHSADRFAPEGVHPLADMVFNLVTAKIIKAKSVGFQPQRGKFEFNEERGGFDFAGQLLLEHSYVNVPSNPEALVGAKALGIDLTPMVEWATKFIDEEGTSCVLERARYERAIEIALNDRAVIVVNGFKLHPATDSKAAVLVAEIPVASEMSVDDVTAKLDGDVLGEVRALVEGKLGAKAGGSWACDHEDCDTVLFCSAPELDMQSFIDKQKAHSAIHTLSLGTQCAFCENPVTIEAGVMTHECGAEEPFNKEPDEPTDDKKPSALASLLTPSKKVAPTGSPFDDAFLSEIKTTLDGSVKDSVRAAIAEQTGRLD